MKGVHIEVRSFILFWKKDELTSNKLMLNSIVISEMSEPITWRGKC